MKTTPKRSYGAQSIQPKFQPVRPGKKVDPWARSIQPKFPEISVQNSMDRFGPTGKVSKKLVHLLRWSSFPGRTGLDFGSMDRAPFLKLHRDREPTQSVCLADCYFTVNVLDLPFASPIAIYR